MEEQLRQYEPWECGTDGYPFAWHGRCTCDQVAVMDANDLCFYSSCTADQAIKDLIREEAHHRCERCLHPYAKGEGEWSLCDERCRHAGPVQLMTTEGWVDAHPADGRAWGAAVHAAGQGRARYRILTVHHLDEDKANCRWWNLVSLCQRCHLRMQRQVVMDTPWHFEHTEWFKPYAAAFYAFKYLNEDLTRSEVMARQDELLALEYQGTQESLL